MKFSERIEAEKAFRAWCNANKVADRPQSVFAWLETSGKDHCKKLCCDRVAERNEVAGREDE